MKSRLTLGVLLFNWIVGLILFFTFSPELRPQFQEDSKSTLQSVNVELSECLQIPESISFEFEWKSQIFMHATGWSSSLGIYSYTTTLNSSFSSLPLFDIKKLFIHFFHTW
ncbi:hypothetical protein [Algoriphagus litoralis]|uniref:hypothetical protein n=1 Tax=Algoriphagus litoralis TaxID=2202829 RepID=UPI000DB92346|nr:hypothetical protein [Algoriphagus litoralis]